MAALTAGAIAGGIGSAVGGMGAGMIGPLLQMGESKKARRFARHMFQRRYQYTMADMRAAGLNPILGIAGGGSQPAMSAPMANISAPDLMSSAKAGVRMKSQKALVAAEVMRAQHAARREGALSALAEWQAVTQKRLASSAKSKAAIDAAMVPLATATGKFYEDEQGKALRVWDLFMKSLVGRGTSTAR